MTGLTFDYMFLKYKEYFIYNNGQAKYNTIEEKIKSSPKIAQLNATSIKMQRDPTQADFGATIQSIGYFMISGGDTSAMAEFIATKYWNETINAKYNFCTEHSLYFKAESILKKWNKRI